MKIVISFVALSFIFLVLTFYFVNLGGTNIITGLQCMQVSIISNALGFIFLVITFIKERRKKGAEAADFLKGSGK